jgi:tripartite-type tricarboxylate transporter receptor subunit TctC
MKRTRLLLRSSLLALAGLSLSLHAAAQSFPSKPIRSIVPAGTGTGSDSLCRIFTEHLAQRIGQPVVTENRPGGNAVIGIDAAVKSPADGYTMLCFGGGSAAPSLHKSLPWDFLKVMDPVVYIYRLGLFLSVSGTLPVSTAQEFIAHAKANPGKLNYYYIAPSQKIAFAYFANRAGIELTEVYYKSGQAHVDLVAGLVHAGMDGPASFRAHLDAGRVKMLFVASNVRSPSYPNIPTSAEVGLGDFQMITGIGYWVPAGTPKDAVARLNLAFNEAMKEPKMVATIQGTGGAAVGGAPEELRRLVEQEHRNWAEGVRIARYVPE